MYTYSIRNVKTQSKNIPLELYQNVEGYLLVGESSCANVHHNATPETSLLQKA